MPRTLPREEIKIVLRPRGGLNVGRIDASRLMAAIFAAAGTSLQESKEDTMCTNVAQNIIVISTSHEGRASQYAGIRLLRVGDRDHEVNAYLSAPNGTAKGVIRGISLSDSNRELQDNIVNDANPLALDAHRIGNTTAVIVVFEGTKVPNYVKYGAMLVKCSLYRQHFEVCRCCGKVGHRTDVCPFPDTRVCFACNAPNPGPDHETECKPRCKLCNGAHPTGAAGCKNRYKVPYVVMRRRWERRHVEAQQPRLGLAEFPQLQPRDHVMAQVASEHGRLRQRSDSRRRSGSQRRSASRSASRKRESKSRERVAWADVVRPQAPERKAVPQQTVSQPQPSPEMLKLRNENERLKKRIAEQDMRMLEMNRKLDLLLANQRQEQAQAQEQAQSQAQAMEVQTEAPAEEAAKVEATTEGPEPRAKRRAIETRAIDRRIQRLEERFDKFEESTNRRLAALEATTADIVVRLTKLEQMFQAVQETLVQLQEAIARLNAGTQYQHPNQRPSWPEQQ